MFFQFIVYLGNSFMDFCLFLSNSTAGPRLHQLPPNLPNLCFSSCLLDTILSLQDKVALIKYESHHTTTLLKMPQGLLSEHLNLNFTSCLLLRTNLLLFCLENNLLSDAWTSWTWLCLWLLCFMINIPSDWNVLPHMSQDLFLPQLAISMHITPRERPPHSFRVKMANTHTSTHTPSFHFSSDSLCYLHFST